MTVGPTSMASADEPEERRRNDVVFLDALMGLRMEVTALRDDMREDSAALRQELGGFALAHAKEHETTRLEAEAEHQTFHDFIRNAELAQARRDGYLGVFRFTVETLNKYWKPIGFLIIMLASVAAALAGALTISVGIH